MKTAVRTAPRKARGFDSPAQEAFLALWRTYDRLRALEDELFARFELTAQQYNVLRLLRAHHPKPLPTLGIAGRLVSRAPDVTRMLDKLAACGLIARDRSTRDRREVLVGITAAGQALVERIARPLADCHERQLGHLSRDELRKLVGLLKRVREPHESADSPWR